VSSFFVIIFPGSQLKKFRDLTQKKMIAIVTRRKRQAAQAAAAAQAEQAS
jgi:hypothetical protein